MLKVVVVAAILFFYTAFQVFAQTIWQVKSADISFKIKNFGMYVHGTLGGLEANIYFSPENLTQSNIEASVKAETINTGNKSRDRHLRKEDYFDVVQFPFLRMKSKKIIKEKDRFIGFFDLTIRNKTQEVQMPFTFSPNGNEATFVGNFTINRRDFGVGGNSWVLGDEVIVRVEVKAQK
ncbi:MAG: YceI family protein [Raineya sp.]|nr:YceI family protein [Raineya sp.]MDW8297100.1 YceI family protein [Raineya sp.]